MSIMEQIELAGRTHPPDGTPLNLDELLQQLYAIKKQREKEPPIEKDYPLFLVGSAEEARALEEKIKSAMEYYYRNYYPVIMRRLSQRPTMTRKRFRHWKRQVLRKANL